MRTICENYLQKLDVTHSTFGRRFRRAGDIASEQSGVMGDNRPHLPEIRYHIV